VWADSLAALSVAGDDEENGDDAGGATGGMRGGSFPNRACASSLRQVQVGTHAPALAVDGVAANALVAKDLQAAPAGIAGRQAAGLDMREAALEARQID
jgi:hypothetical protein